jgi:hypothetical protein
MFFSVFACNCNQQDPITNPTAMVCVIFRGEKEFVDDDFNDRLKR